MRILVYGFGVYRKFKDNVTGKIIRRLPRRRQLSKIIFPVKFHRRQFIDAIKQHDPEVILGLGQCSRGRRLRIERRAVNKWRNQKREKARPIVRGGPPQIRTNLLFNLGPAARISRNAGDYVCNYSMYVMLDYLKHRGSPTRYGFAHVPHDYDLRKALRILVKAIDRIEAASFQRHLPQSPIRHIGRQDKEQGGAADDHRPCPTGRP